MTSTLELPAPAPAQAIKLDSPPRDLFDTMRAVVRCRRELRTVPAELVDELRGSHLASLVDAIDRYNARMSRLSLTA